jgi:hypothetical protein
MLLLASVLDFTRADALTVTSPASGSSTVAAGNDFATQIVGDAWDMSNPQDIDTDESSNLATQTFSGGLFTATSSNCSAGVSFYPQFTGDGSDIVAIERGPRFPIDTSVYRYFTIKFKTSTAQDDRVLFLENGDSYATGTYGSGIFQVSSANQWIIQTWDLYTDTYGSAQGYMPWTSFPQVQGIRFDPCNSGSATIQVDWIRLTAPSSTGQSYTVTWSDTVSSTYTIAAVDSDGAIYQFATGVSGTSYSADFSRLAPGDYHVAVTRASPATTATSSGVVHVNAPPQIAITAPTMRGEQSLSYAVQEQGTQWGPMSAADFNPSPPPNFKNVSYTGGVFTGRPTSGDPNFIMNTTGHPIDADYYRSLCFTMSIAGTRNFADGWIARIFWAQNLSNITTTKDIIVNTGTTEYCLADLADTSQVPLAPPSTQTWAGNLIYFRMDPDELTPPNGCSTAATCHDITLNSVILAPFASADPGYTFQWTMTTDKPSVQLTLALDSDETPNNGNETVIYNQSVANGNGTFAWNGAGGPAVGTYHLLATVSDAVNSVSRYSTGPIVVTVTDDIFRNGFETP